MSTEVQVVDEQKFLPIYEEVLSNESPSACQTYVMCENLVERIAADFRAANLVYCDGINKAKNSVEAHVYWCCLARSLAFMFLMANGSREYRLLVRAKWTRPSGQHMVTKKFRRKIFKSLLEHHNMLGVETEFLDALFHNKAFTDWIDKYAGLPKDVKTYDWRKFPLNDADIKTTFCSTLTALLTSLATEIRGKYRTNGWTSFVALTYASGTCYQLGTIGDGLLSIATKIKIHEKKMTSAITMFKHLMKSLTILKLSKYGGIDDGVEETFTWETGLAFASIQGLMMCPVLLGRGCKSLGGKGFVMDSLWACHYERLGYDVWPGEVWNSMASKTVDAKYKDGVSLEDEEKKKAEEDAKKETVEPQPSDEPLTEGTTSETQTDEEKQMDDAVKEQVVNDKEFQEYKATQSAAAKLKEEINTDSSTVENDETGEEEFVAEPGVDGPQFFDSDDLDATDANEELDDAADGDNFENESEAEEAAKEDAEDEAEFVNEIKTNTVYMKKKEGIVKRLIGAISLAMPLTEDDIKNNEFDTNFDPNESSEEAAILNPEFSEYHDAVGRAHNVGPFQFVDSDYRYAKRCIYTRLSVMGYTSKYRRLIYFLEMAVAKRLISDDKTKRARAIYSRFIDKPDCWCTRYTPELLNAFALDNADCREGNGSYIAAKWAHPSFTTLEDKYHHYKQQDMLEMK